MVKETHLLSNCSYIPNCPESSFCHIYPVCANELAHMEMIATIVHQLTRNLSMEEIEKSGLGPYYIDHTVGIWPQAAAGIPFNTCEFQVKGDPVTDLFEDMAAEQKARSTYDNILRVVRDIPEIADPIKFLRAREVVHFQRFGEAKSSYTNKIVKRNVYRNIEESLSIYFPYTKVCVKSSIQFQSHPRQCK